jgi:predicted transcriptional regulator
VRFLDQAPRRLVALDTEPAGFVAEWEVCELDELPADDVQHYMTTRVVTAGLHTRLGELARIMQREHIHRVLITDADKRLVGVVASMDVLGAVAAADAAPQL